MRPGATFIRASESTLASAFETLRVLAGQRPLFAVLDAARDENLPSLLEHLRLPFRSLYHGPEGDALAPVAPYIAELTKDPQAARRLLQEGWGDARGLFLSATGTLVAVRRHLRRLLLAELGEDRERVLFRFYDPRVLRAIFPVCTDDQKRILFGEAIECFVMEDEDGTPLVLRREEPGAPPGYHRKSVALRFTEAQAESVLLYGRKLVEFVADLLRTNKPEIVAGMAPDALESMISVALARARGHGFKTPSDLSVFAMLMFEVAPNFDEHPAMRDTFAQALKPDSGGLGDALSELPDHVWRECGERRDDRVWSDAAWAQEGSGRVWTR